MPNPRTPLISVASVLVACCVTPLVHAQQVMPNLWTPDGTVFTTAVSGNTLYMGGVFRFLGRSTGGGAALDSSTGVLLPASPRVNGTVRVITPDGAGGWFLGGEFDRVGTFARQNLARLNPDLSVAAWDPGANLAVYALALSGTRLYVGGSFTTCGGLPRSGIAALDATTGAPNNWDPTANATVLAIVVNNNIVYAGGLFSAIGGSTRYGIAALATNNGHATAWSPSSDAGSIVGAITLKGGTVLLCGSFIHMGGQPRARLAEVQASTGVATTWDPNVDLDVRAMALSGTTLYIGGIFSNVGGQPRTRLAAVSSVSGLPTAWNAGIGPNAVVSEVDALLLVGQTLYVGGNFTAAGGQSRRCLAALDATSGVATAWDSNAGPSDNTELHAFALAANGGTIFAGGDFTMAGLVRRDNLGAVDLTSGLPTNWNPRPSGIVRCMATSGSKVYIGGDFLQVAFGQHARVAAIDAVSGVPDPWNAASDNLVTAIAVDNGTIYVGGNFASIGGRIQYSVAALDAATGLALSWNPNADPGLDAIAVSGNTVYLGGTFQNVGGQVRRRLAAVDRTTAAVLPWNPDITTSSPATATVHDIAIGPGAVYVGGVFDRVGGVPRGNVAAIDPVSGLATAWNPSANFEVEDVETAGSTIYLGGGFNSVGGLPRNRVAAVSDQGVVTAWNPNANGFVFAISTTNGNVCIGGSFSQVAGLPLNSAAVMNDPFVVGVPGREPWGGGLTASVAPHPMTSESLLRFALPRAGIVSVELLDTAGRRARSLLRSQWLDAGPHELRLERGELSAGLYFVRLRTSEGTVSRKLVVTR